MRNQSSSADGQPAINPWRHVARERDERRYEMFLLAAPVFARHGFRGATVRALAHACHVSPAGLYHYFRSKKELATYALRSPRAGWDRTHIDAAIHPLIQLRRMLDLAVDHLPVYMLSLRMLDEIGDRAAEQLRLATFREGEQMLGRFVSEAGAGMPREEAEETARLLIAVLVGSAFAGLDADASAVRRRSLDLLRARLVPRYLEGEALEGAFAGWAE